MLLFVAAAGIAAAQTPEIAEIMARVAANQAASLEQRQNWVFHQKQLFRLMRPGGKVECEERREYTVTPSANGIQKELTRFEGKYEENGKFVPYDKPDRARLMVDVNGARVGAVGSDLADDETSKDGIAKSLFPLTYKEQLKYQFHLVRTEQYRTRRVFRIAFEPRAGSYDTPWKGEALIDAEEFQPVYFSTKLASKVPMAVRILLGTNVKDLGFSVSYQKFAEGLWFPVSYGGEFEVRALFFFRRNISISMANDDFRRTDVASSVTYKAEDK